MEIFTLLFSTVLVQSAREYGLRDTHFAWTRRIIALSAIFSIIVLPKVAPLVYPDTPWIVTVGYLEMQGGFLTWLFGPETSYRMGVVPRSSYYTP
jgi:hypothetical protein